MTFSWILYKSACYEVRSDVHHFDTLNFIIFDCVNSELQPEWAGSLVPARKNSLL